MKIVAKVVGPVNPVPLYPPKDMKKNLKDKLDDHRILLNNYYKTHYYSGQVVDMYDPVQKKHRKVIVVTAGGGRVKIRDNGNTYWVEADKIGKYR